MCFGVVIGFAGMKFSGSPNMFGVNKTIVRKRVMAMAIPKRSL